VRLSAPGAAVFDALVAPGAPELPAAAARLATRLVTAGLLHPRPQADPGRVADVSVVVPVRDDADGLGRLASRWSATPVDGGAPRLLIVDDGSRPGQAERIAHLARAAGARLVRLEVPRGPAAARNAGLELVTTPFVAFVDADADPEPSWLEMLLGHFDDASVVAVAPRVVAGLPPATGRRSPGPGPEASAVSPMLCRLLGYERCRSPLDLGPDPGIVGRAHRVRYVPAAAIVLRCDALRAVGGFAAALRYGEDVDLVWRLADAGGTVRYEPASLVEHAIRPTIADLVSQRFAYGTSAAALDRRHPGSVPAFEAGRWSAVAAGALPAALVARRVPRLSGAFVAGALFAFAVPWLRLARKLATSGDPRPTADAARLVAAAHWFALESLRCSLRRAWWPIAAFVLVAARRDRLATGALATWLAVSSASVAPPGAGADPLSVFALGLIDDVAYGAGVWAGAGRARRVGPLLGRCAAARGSAVQRPRSFDERQGPTLHLAE
jgi:mycofactocin system glycosyltransferase